MRARLASLTASTAAANYHSGSRFAFTLIELLVVIAVIALLAAMLFPAFGTSKTRTKRIACLNNLKQFALADSMYCHDHGRLPPANDFVPSSITIDRLARVAQYFSLPMPQVPAAEFPKRPQQPKWMNCPMAADSGYAEGITVGGGLYTGYTYVGGAAESKMVSLGFATLVNPDHNADTLNTRRGVLWSDVLNEFHTTDTRRYEFFHTKTRRKYPDFRLYASDLDGIHRAWSDASVEWIPATKIQLTGSTSPDLRIRHLLGNFYY